MIRQFCCDSNISGVLQEQEQEQTDHFFSQVEPRNILNIKKDKRRRKLIGHIEQQAQKLDIHKKLNSQFAL